MKRWALNTVSAISLFLFIAIAGMWVRSYFVSDRLTWPNPNFKPPPAHPTIIYGEGHVDWRPSAEASSELQYAGILVIQGSRVLNSGLGVVEFVIDSPPWRQIGPMHVSPGLPPDHFAGYNATWRTSPINSQTIAIGWSSLGFSHDEMSGYLADGIYPPPGTPKTVFVKRWIIPYWPAAVLSGVLPFLWLVRTARAWSRHKEGHCARCGYDLRATPERCPECGAISGKPTEPSP